MQREIAVKFICRYGKENMENCLFWNGKGCFIDNEACTAMPFYKAAELNKRGSNNASR